MKIILSALSRFHIFHMAIELEKKYLLEKIITGYPKYKLRGEWENLSKFSVNLSFFGLLWKILIIIENRKFPFFIVSNFRKFIYKHFSKNVSRKVSSDDDFLIGLSGFMRDAIDVARKNNVKSIVDHGSLHEAVCREILLDECEKFGFSSFGNWQHDWMLERMDYEFENADYIFVCSELAKKTMIENNIDEKKIFVNQLGIDLSKFSYKNRVAADSFKFLHISNMSPIKGLHYIIESFNRLNKLYTNIELWLVGPYPNEVILQKMIVSNTNIKYFSPVVENKLVDYYHACDLFVHPSLSDGWGMTVMQAMATGLPVILSDMTGASEIIHDGENGWIIPSKNSEELYKRMEFSLNNRERLNSMGLNAFKAVKDAYTWDDYGNRLSNWLKQNA